jgi:hypothetical protein
MTDPDLIRFLDAQDQIFGQVIDELTKGRARSASSRLPPPNVSYAPTETSDGAGALDLCHLRTGSLSADLCVNALCHFDALHLSLKSSS